MKINFFWLIAALAWCTLIFFATASPSATGSSTSLFFETLFNLSEKNAALLNVIFRKSVHLGAFGLLAILFYMSFGKRFWLSWMLTTIYAATDEIHQRFLPERTGSFLDVAAMPPARDS